MPGWLQVIASLNPLSYAIEPIRYIYLHPGAWNFVSVVMDGPLGTVTMGTALGILTAFCGASLLLIQPLLRRRIV
jgi:ABC-2 type transport system permease protein